MVELFKHDLILSFAKDKRVLHIGACDYPYHLVRAEQGELLHQKLDQVAAELIGIDNNRQAINDLRRFGIDNIYFGDIEKDIYDIDFENLNFDIILLPDVIEHLTNPGLALLNIKRRFMEDNTKLIITTPNVFKWHNLRTIITGNEVVHPDHVFWPSYKTMKTLFERVGLKIEFFSYVMYGEYSKITKKGQLFYKLFYKNIPHFMPTLFFVLTLQDNKESVT
ncbi:class I SAM-dependent methyltransferase [Pyrococcus kukulkanii]|uniref:Methyltransferase n=1 Tax=Pyrococcus kukulkanii TaxID=1609559 RepID=A0A127B8E2_9EURY|nr:methyltransferase domain-containing protein [Pyrococcus kukulkanii]AMM53538.1 hypothetical protein TQ32_02850 [Pyrococcus kukulkanii]